MAEQEPHAAQAERPPEGVPSRVPIRDLVRYFLRLGALGFGGPVALCGQMERELVGERKWLTREEMREAIAVCQSLPGPLAIQVGIFISYLRGGFWGAWAGGWEVWLAGIVVAGRTRPIGWAVLPYPWPKGRFRTTTLALIQQLQRAFPAGGHGTLGADRFKLEAPAGAEVVRVGENSEEKRP